eukprot:CAMPEP_0118852524 /NCGR_PEP_ID=MMETSP1163-20130328/1493_1 /TAXON_ID=124430 /ORGANISM="Phaeomonas parva, Strain CCMP2877" /LENGTH=215 /DNA_ID=CAMNT_0006784959 /DNA_START=66 /DNA_END=713 /DNA_ORIENTATION=+
MAKDKARAKAKAAGAGKEAASDGKKQTLWARYQSLLVRYPLRMNMLQSAFISALGNLTKQLAIDGAPLDEVDWYGVRKSYFMAMFFVAPVVSFWFSLLGSFKVGFLPSVILDQTVFSPTFNIYFFLMFTAISGGIEADYGADGDDYSVGFTLKTAMFPSLYNYDPVWSTMVKSWSMWLPAAVVRESVVPPHLRPIFNNCVNFFWQIILALALSKA